LLRNSLKWCSEILRTAVLRWYKAAAIAWLHLVYMFVYPTPHNATKLGSSGKPFVMPTTRCDAAAHAAACCCMLLHAAACCCMLLHAAACCCMLLLLWLLLLPLLLRLWLLLVFLLLTRRHH